jgi:hypothetical protein
VFVEYASDVDSAVDVLCRGTDFAEAYRLVSPVTTYFLDSSDRVGIIARSRGFGGVGDPSWTG